MPTDKELFKAALDAAVHSYSPYSRFRVGAALLCEDGRIVIGANVENRSFGLTICAERSALVSAVSAGSTKFKAIAIATPDSSYPVGPCGACRQVLSEFLEPGARVIFGPVEDSLVFTNIGELLPYDSLHDLARGDQET
ncbi:MAG: cytidine deaminase [Spirochaetota bacterium]